MNNSNLSNEWAGDVLHRKKYALFLTQYLKEKSEGYVININGPWGSGKTFFVKKWMDDVNKNFPAVYFNAWKNDYSEDPLISIISSINNEIIPLLPDNDKKKDTTKRFLLKSGMMLKKLAPFILKAGLRKAIGEEGLDELSEITTETEDSIIEISSKVAEILNSHETISSSIDDFKESIELLLKEVITDESLTLPLFVFIDELDRCRPLYSIELLERIKHIFDIPGVVFIIATDTQQLSQSVKAIYGEKFNGEIYLRRFFDQIYTLPAPSCIEFTQLLFENFSPHAKYFTYHINSMGGSSDKYSAANNAEENKNTLTCTPSDHAENILLFSLFAIFFKLDLRTKKQCFDRFIAIEKSLSENEELHFGYLIFLIMMDAINPSKFQEYFTCSTQRQRKEILNEIGDPLDNIRIYNQQFTAKYLIGNYSDNLFSSEQELRRSINEIPEDGFELNLTISLHDNLKYLAKYKERVEMAEALGQL